LHIKLLCKHKPDEVIDYLKGNTAYPINECLEICKVGQYRHDEATAYLYERNGQLDKAVQYYIKVYKSLTF
jgi:hypothetical protein